MEYGYDGRGNLTAIRAPEGETTYHWDGLGRLREVDLPSGEALHYHYDGLGNLVGRDGPDGSWRCLVLEHSARGTSDCAAYADEDGNELATVTYDTWGPYARASGGAGTYLHRGTLHSIVAATDGDGDLVGRARYEPFGTPAPGEIPGDHGFAGEWSDPHSGLVYLRARFYHPGIRRFLSPDPLPVSIYRPADLNRYAYARSDPLNLVDPTGAISMTLCELTVGLTIQSLWQMAKGVADVLKKCNLKAKIVKEGARAAVRHLVMAIIGSKAKTAVRLLEKVKSEAGLDEGLRNLLCPFGGGLKLGTFTFQHKVTNCGRSKGKKQGCSMKVVGGVVQFVPGKHGDYGIDLVYDDMIPIELKKSGGITKPRMKQMIRYCRWASREGGSHVVVYLSGGKPSQAQQNKKGEEIGIARAATICATAWKDHSKYGAGVCIPGETFGSALVFIGWDKKKRRPDVYVPELSPCEIIVDAVTGG